MPTKEEIDEPEQPIKALDEGDIALLKTYVSTTLNCFTHKKPFDAF